MIEVREYETVEEGIRIFRDVAKRAAKKGLTPPLKLTGFLGQGCTVEIDWGNA